MTSLSGIIQYLYFCVCLFSLSILFLRSMHVVRHVSELHSFSWLNSIPSAVFPFACWLDYLHHSACFHLLVTVNNVAMNTGIQVPVQVPAFLLSWVSTIPRSGIAGLYGNSMFNFLKNHQLYHFTFSPAIPKFSISPHPHKHLLFCFVIATPNGWQRPRWWERLKAGGEGDDRGQDGWMASPTQWTWVWASSRRWWRTGKPGVLQSMGLQRIGHDWATEHHPHHLMGVN